MENVFFSTFWKYLPFDQTEKSMETVWSHSFSKFVAQDADRFLWIASSSMAAWSFIGHLKKFLKGLKIFFFEIFWNGILLPKLFWPPVIQNSESTRLVPRSEYPRDKQAISTDNGSILQVTLKELVGFHFLFYILILIYFFKYETIVSRNGLSLGYS